MCSKVTGFNKRPLHGSGAVFGRLACNGYSCDCLSVTLIRGKRVLTVEPQKETFEFWKVVINRVAAVI